MFSRRATVLQTIYGTSPLPRIVCVFVLGFAVAGCGNGLTVPVEEPDPDPPPFVVGETGGPGVDVVTPYSAPLSFETVSADEGRVVEEMVLDLDGSGEPNLVLVSERLPDMMQQLLTIRNEPGTRMAVLPGADATVPDGFTQASTTLRAPRVPGPGTVLDGDSLTWAEDETLYVLFVSRNMSFAPTGFRLLGDSNHLVFRIGDRLGWVELGPVTEGVLQVEGMEVVRVGLRVEPGEG